MKLKTTLFTWAVAPLVFAAGCDAGPCENTRSCGDWDAGGNAGQAGNGGATNHGGEVSNGAGTGGRIEPGGGAAAEGGQGGFGQGGANEAGAGGMGGGVACDTSKSPSEEPCLISDLEAVFVAPTGSDKGSGTQAAPFRSVGKAVETAAATGKLIIACNATFEESIALSAGARIYGGFACPTEDAPWTYVPETRTKLAPLNEGPALAIQGVTDAVILEDLEFVAQKASMPGGSSIGALVVSSTNVGLRRSRIQAGDGAAGTDGVPGLAGADGDMPLSDQRGGDAVCGTQAPLTRDGGRWLAPSACGSRGGAGGQAQRGDLGFPGASGTPLLNVVPEGVNNRGVEAPATPANAPGGDGKAGSPGKAGSAGIATADASSFTEKGFTPSAPGGSGGDGFPGQGGGGGAASNALGTCIGASGGAGGMGGCGGKGGTGGEAGGASVALLSWDSKVTLDTCELVASSGGAGGKGGNGGAGGAGKAGAEGGLGFADSTNELGKGGNGGKGGDGGVGGPAAGGNGGPSYALVFHGPIPLKVNATTLATGNGGAGGPGGDSGLLKGAIGNTGRTAEQLAITTP
ncbi:MAG: hypothetical protein ACOY0T_14785 [Myxococcota bacterium]